MAGQIDGVGDQRRRHVGRGGADRASTVTASAIPRESERPLRPLVAMPRIGEAANMSIEGR